VSSANGIVCGIGCLVEGNSAGGNGAYGLSLGADSAYRANALVGNASGAVSGGVNRGDNHCAGPGVAAATCP
jgi:hypothetical protein